MRLDADAIRALPTAYQEQVAIKMAAELAKAANVAEHDGNCKANVSKVRRLCFPSVIAKERYRVLRDAVREGVISDLHCETYDSQVCAFTYRIRWAGEFLPHTLPVRDLILWAKTARQSGKGTVVAEKMIEPVKRKRDRYANR